MQIDTDSGATDWIDSRTTVRSRSGAITVTTTAHGLPVAVRITESAMAMGAEALAEGAADRRQHHLDQSLERQHQAG